MITFIHWPSISSLSSINEWLRLNNVFIILHFYHISATGAGSPAAPRCPRWVCPCRCRPRPCRRTRPSPRPRCRDTRDIGTQGASTHRVRMLDLSIYIYIVVKIPKIIDPMQTKNHHSYNLYNFHTLTHEHTSTPTHLHTNTPTHQHINTPTH